MAGDSIPRDGAQLELKTWMISRTKRDCEVRRSDTARVRGEDYTFTAV